ncbi:MAG: hypothetical protein ACREBS_06400 [Nitrososphaerales archaeon]
MPHYTIVPDYDSFLPESSNEATTNFDFGDAVIRLSPTLQEVDYFAPANWADINSRDVDLGSVGPAILNNGTIFQVGKEGLGYLLNANALGRIGGQEFSAQVCSGGAGAYGGTVFAAQFLYVPCSNGVVALRVNLTSTAHVLFSNVWTGPQSNAGPPIIAGNLVWDIDRSSGILYALNENDGSVIFTYQMSNVVRFTTPSSADGQIFVAAVDTIVAVVI